MIDKITRRWPRQEAARFARAWRRFMPLHLTLFRRSPAHARARGGGGAKSTAPPNTP